MQVIGITILVLIGAGLAWWIIRAAMGLLRGRPIYMLPDHDADTQDDEDSHGSH